ncbi:hypothetical protein ACFW2Z_19040 [Streptomyces sp. NPDC058866]|uniref:hypothetical protein n=1 Tax=unclassified Streptomyces TaxID=2593676 RepID=UPI0036BDD55A
MRNQLIAVIGLVVWGTLGQLMVLSQFPKVGRFLPDGAQLAVLGDRLTLPSALDAPYGLLVLVAWCAALALPAQRMFTSHDVWPRPARPGASGPRVLGPGSARGPG